jgi:hypothetical protein
VQPIYRVPWGDFPDVVIPTNVPTLRAHLAYQQGKLGDPDSALRRSAPASKAVSAPGAPPLLKTSVGSICVVGIKRECPGMMANRGPFSGAACCTPIELPHD